MKCSKLRRLLADGGPAALAGNREAEDHLVDCGECYAVLEAMTEIDSLLPGLPGYDVADEVVDQLLANSELGGTPVHGSDALGGRLAWLRDRVGALSPIEMARQLGVMVDRVRQARVRWGIVAVPAVLLIGIVSVLTMRSVVSPLSSKEPYVVKQVKFKDSVGEPVEGANREEWEEEDRPSSSAAGSGVDIKAGEGGGDGWSRPLVVDQVDSREIPKPAAKKVVFPDPASNQPETGKELNEVTAEMGAVTVTGALIPQADQPAEAIVVDLAQAPPVAEFGRDRDDRVDGNREPMDGLTESETKNEEASSSQGMDKLRLQNQLVVGDEVAGRRSEESRQGGMKPNQEPVETKRDQNSYRHESTQIEDVELESEDSFDLFKNQSALAEVVSETDDEALSVARRFLADRNRIEDLIFQESRGYWANTYVPGDRTLRQLKARLDRADDASVTGNLHDNAHQISQPFDPPEGAALAVYLHGDRPGVETRERMLIQIGLKATSRRSGVRPAMNIGLVLDLRGEVAPESAAAMRALLQAFAAASELGDRFSLTVAGRPGGTVLQPGDLRHGPLTVAMTELFGDQAAGPVLDLEQAATAALATVRADDDPNAPLGSSALIVITSRELGAVTGLLAGMADHSAIDGVPWSAIGIGRGVDLAELDSLVLAGQGNRRLLESAADAGTLVDRELAAVSRVVARAVRLRIRLAPGVQLIDVIGSQRLDENCAQQVRDAEQSIDQRLSRNLGIETDRGLDEEGIQIVIPSYYADDAHVVLLDVVVPGPGPVADVTVRYKDLVRMRNGVARAHLRVGRAGTAAGPLELNVLANLLATEVASGLDAAADAVAVGDIDTARTILIQTRDLLRGLASQVDGLGQNTDLAADLEMIAGYIDALSILVVDDLGRLQTTADSLRYAGRLKILPPPVGDDQPE